MLDSRPQGYSAPLMGGSAMSEPGSRGNKPAWKRAVRKVYKTLTQPEKDESGQRIPITRSISQRLSGSGRAREGRASGFFTPRSSTSSVPMLDKPGPHSARSSEHEFAETARTAPLPYMSPFPSPIKPPSQSGAGSEPLETPRPNSDAANKDSAPAVYINPRHAAKRAAAAAQTAAAKQGGKSQEAPRPSTAPMKSAAEAVDAAAGAGAHAAKRAFPDTQEDGQQAKRAHEEAAPTKASVKAAVVPSEADQAGAAAFQAKVESGESDPSFKFKAATDTGDEQPGKRKFGVTRRLVRMALAVGSVAVAAVAFGVVKIGE